MNVAAESLNDFMALFRGYPSAYGTGKGGWVKQKPLYEEFSRHLNGQPPGLGIGPLMADGTCWFAAIDLDRPDFGLAQQLSESLPGVNWVERSRSGNAHILAFFSEPIEAWIPRGIMREALAAFGERTVEVFPKNDRLLPGMFGNYLNLPYHGEDRPIIAWKDDEGFKRDWKDIGPHETTGVELDRFVKLAMGNRNDPREWRKRARWLGVPSPEEREATGTRSFGTAPHLHMCGEYVLTNRETNPVATGHRAVVFFSLAKMLANWSEVDSDEALNLLTMVNDCATDPIPAEELERILFNAERGQFTSTGCDDPLFLPYAHPDCKIANGA